MQTYVEEKSTNFWNVMICGRSRNDPYFFLSYIYTRIQHRFTLEHFGPPFFSSSSPFFTSRFLSKI